MGILLSGMMLSFVSTFPAAADPGLARRAVDLDEPGVLEALRGSHPTHYVKIRRILAGVTRQPDADVPRWIQTTFDARSVTYAPLVLTSHPAKRRLSFVLDSTRYEAIVVLTNVRGNIVPAR